MGKKVALTFWLLLTLMLAGVIWMGYSRYQRERLRVPLLEAAGRGDDAEVQRLLSLGADPNSRDLIVSHRSAWQVVLDSLHPLRHRQPALEDKPTALMIACTGERVVPPKTDVMPSDPYNDCWKIPGWCPNADAGRDDPVAVRLLLDRGARVNAKGRKGWTALMSAAVTGHNQTAHVLLSHGADPDPVWEDQTPLITATNRGNSILVGLLLDDGADPNALPLTDSLQSVPLASAAFQGNVPLAQALLDHGADVNASQRSCLTPLAAAVEGHQKTMTRFLLSRKASVNAVSIDGNTALIWASIKNDPQTVALLLSLGANANAINRAGHTALYFASGSAVVRMLLKPGASRAMKTIALEQATWRGDVTSVCLLLNQGADPNGRDWRGGTCLINALDGDEKVHEATALAMLRPLLAHGADINLPDREGKTPLMHCVQDEPSLRLLLSHRVEINVRTPDGLTALLQAVANTSPSSVRLLLSHGADPNLRGSGGSAALTCAAGGYALEQEHGATVTITRLLLAHGANPDLQDNDGLTARKLMATFPPLKAILAETGQRGVH